jgi:cellulase (glycosyl hydrolase family 5)
VVVLRWLAVTAAAFSLVVVTASAGSVRVRSTPGTAPLVTAIADPALFASGQRAKAFALTRAAGATYARLTVEWRAIAPSTRPEGFVATDPGSPGYSWGGLDAAVQAADAVGLTAILDISTVPRWAYSRQPHRPNAGTPRAAALGDFATALAKHYDGSTSGLPDEHVFQVWNEPNLSLDLYPISTKSYRNMVNAVAGAVHAVDPANLVVAGALEPVGHPKKKGQKWYSIAPLAFMRSLLCVSKGVHPHSTCRNAVHFDVWSHHPYTTGGPFGRAKIRDDVMLGDLPRMRALLRAGVRFHHVVSAHPVRFWVTEFGWDTRPPRPNAAPLALAARWTAESLHQMWLSGVSLVTWYLLQDYPSPSPYQSGFYFSSDSLDDARPKASLTAFRFPFVAYLRKGGVPIWGRVATSDERTVGIQLRHGKHGTWQTVASIESNRYGIFRGKLPIRASKQDWLRATAPGSRTSLAFSLTRPKDPPRIGPWGY